ncbi:MAG: arylesterase [Nitrospirae bacterium]|nr:arylesterase [Candidatus Manganitrophaceae bacterium]
MTQSILKLFCISKEARLKRKVVFWVLAVLLFGGSGVSPAVARAQGAVRERVIVAFGDSLTAGLGVAPNEGYPAVLEQKLRAAGYSYRIINSGVSGETTAGGLRRVDWVLRSRPDLVILELGANDGLRGLDLGETEKNLAAMIERLQKTGAVVILAGMKLPPNYGRGYTEGFEKIYPRLAARYHLTLIPFFLDGVAAQSNLNQADGIHPTAQGYRIIVDRIWPVIEPLLKR